VKDFVEFLVRNNASCASTNRGVKLKGLWKGRGFERINVEMEIKDVRRALGEQIQKRLEKWNM